MPNLHTDTSLICINTDGTLQFHFSTVKLVRRWFLI